MSCQTIYLPEELLVEIFVEAIAYTPKSIGSIACLSKRYKEILDKRFFWKKVIDRCISPYCMPSEDPKKRYQLYVQGKLQFDHERRVSWIQWNCENRGYIGLSGDGRRAITGTWEQESKLLEIGPNGYEERILCSNEDVIQQMALSADGKKAVLVWYRTIKVFDLDSASCLRAFTKTREDDRYRIKSTDGERVFLGCFSNRIKVWDINTGNALYHLSAHESCIVDCSLSANGKRIISGTVGQEVRLWDVDSGSCLQILEGHEDRIVRVSLSADGCRAMSASDDKIVKIWDVDSGSCLYTFASEGNIVSVSISADGKRAAFSEGRKLSVWDLKSGVCTYVSTRSTSFRGSLSLSVDGSMMIASCSILDFGVYRPAIEVWEL